MAKARIVTADGAEVNLEGSAAEIAALLRELNIQPQQSSPATKPDKSNKLNKTSARPSVGDLLDELIVDQFFKKPKGMGELKKQLGNMGHHYPLTSLSGPLMGYVRRRKLRRFKESNKYLYSQ
jgi:hypothetical protein